MALGLAFSLLAALLALPACESSSQSSTPSADGYLFCFWNVENLFDDQDNERAGPDREYDPWFAKDPAALKLKLDHLSEALIQLNGGKGPDILAIVEVENIRAAELLRDALNAKLSDKALHYTNLLMKDYRGGRHIAPAILTRLPVKKSKTRLYVPLRILEGHIEVNGQDLVIIASHWTSRVSDATGKQRAKYADQIYGIYKGMARGNPNVPLLVCGDCNDPPDAESVTRHLHATDNREDVLKQGGEPLLLNLLAGKNPAAGFGTHYYRGKWSTFDQIMVSPGLLGTTGWTCDPASVKVVNSLCKPGDKKRRPWRFGSKNDQGPRGYSDHFPVTVQLKLQQEAKPE